VSKSEILKLGLSNSFFEITEYFDKKKGCDSVHFTTFPCIPK